MKYLKAKIIADILFGTTGAPLANPWQDGPMLQLPLLLVFISEEEFGTKN
jgi:hypothetical protein